MAAYVPGIEDVKANNDQSYLKESMELHVACRDIVKSDLLSKSDPFVVVYMRHEGKFVEIGRTEVINNCTNAEFVKSFPIDYYFEKEIRLKFDIYDCDKPGSARLKDHDFLGTCNVTLGEVVHSPGAMMSCRLVNINGKPMKSKKQYSRLILSAIKMAGLNDKFKIKFDAINLPKMDTFGKIDAYFRICKIEDTEKHEYKLKDFKQRAIKSQYKSEIIKSNYSPQWKEFELRGRTLFGNTQTSKQFEVQIYDWDKSSDDDFVGAAIVNVDDLKKSHSNKNKGNQIVSFNIELFGNDLIKKYRKKADKDKPKIILTKCQQLATMYDFLQGGCDFSLFTAVDYTGSNLEHAYGNSPAIDLHHIFYNTNSPSQYQLAIRKIGNILQYYDSDQLYPLWGFGLWGPFTDNPQRRTTKHGFNVNTEMLGFDKEEVGGIYGLENLYAGSLAELRKKTFQLSGPTYFSQILGNAYTQAFESFNSYKQGQGRLTYFIFLIITDGAVSTEDMLPTINEIVAIATKNLPVSIIIVGVGEGPFNTMNLLDGDFLSDIRAVERDGKLSSKKKEEKICNLLNETGYKQEYVDALRKIGDRDIVDFISLNEFDPHTLMNKNGISLEEATLKEIPTHFLKFIQKNGIPIPEKIERKEEDFDMVLRQGTSIQGGQDMYYPDLSKMYDQQQQQQQQNQQQKQGNVNYYDDAPLPPDWERGFMPDGRVYFVNHRSKLTQWMVCYV